MRSEYGRRAVSAPSNRLRADPDRWLVLATTLAWAALLVAFTVLTPVWRSPDETNHFDLVLDVADGRGYAAWDEDHLSEGVLAASEPVRTAPLRVPIEPGADPPGLPAVVRSDRISTVPNHMTQHPPAYYALTGVELAVAQQMGLAPDSVSGQLAVTRVLSALLLVPVPFLAWAAARALGASARVRRLSLLVPLAVPGVTQVGSGLTNDVLSVLVFSALAVGLAAYVGGRRTRGVSLAIGALCGAALLTKAFGAAAVVWAAAVVAATWEPGERRRVLRDSSIVGVTAMAIGGWWYVRNLVREGRILPSLEEARFSSDSVLAGTAKSFDAWYDRFTPVAGRGFFGLFGYADVSVSDLVYRAALVAALGGAVAGAVALRRARPALVLLILPLPVLLGLQATQSYRLYQQSGVVALGHGRYLLPAIVPCALLVATGVARWTPARGRWPAIGLWAAAVAIHLHAAARLLDFFWADGGGLDAVRVATDWSPLPRALSGSAMVGAGIMLVVLAALLLRPPAPDEAPASGPPPLRPAGGPAGSRPATGAPGSTPPAR